MHSESNNSVPCEYKVTILGTYGVGKTSLIRRCCHDTFSLTVPETRGIADCRKELTVYNQKVLMHLSDTAGTEKYRAVNSLFVRNACGAALVYDVTRRESFEDLKYWHKQVKSYAEEAVLVVVGNKIDQVEKRTVSREEGEEYARSIGAEHIESSAMHDICVSQVFEKVSQLVLAKSLRKRLSTFEDNSAGRKFSLMKPKRKKRFFKC